MEVEVSKRKQETLRNGRSNRQSVDVVAVYYVYTTSILRVYYEYTTCILRVYYVYTPHFHSPGNRHAAAGLRAFDAEVNKQATIVR